MPTSQRVTKRLMTQLSDSIKTFYADLKNHGVDDKVLSMTFSEFGRRVAENGSSGTDHGSAAPIMLFGPHSMDLHLSEIIPV